MNRRAKIVSFTGLGTLFMGIALAFSAGTAWAHHPVLDGGTTCTDSDHVIAWAVGNSQPNIDMSIVTATAVLDTNNTPYAVTGYDVVVPGGGSTTAQTIVPGALTGTVTLTIDGLWTDGRKNEATFPVALGDPCTPVTTPTTGPPPTTTPTTGPPPTTIPTTPPTTGPHPTLPPPPPTVVPHPTAPPTPPTGSVIPPITLDTKPCVPTPTHKCSLAFTGSSPWTTLVAVLAVTLIALGVLMIIGAGFATRPRMRS